MCDFRLMLNIVSMIAIDGVVSDVSLPGLLQLCSLSYSDVPASPHRPSYSVCELLASRQSSRLYAS